MGAMIDKEFISFQQYDNKPRLSKIALDVVKDLANAMKWHPIEVIDSIIIDFFARLSAEKSMIGHQLYKTNPLCTDAETGERITGDELFEALKSMYQKEFLKQPLFQLLKHAIEIQNEEHNELGKRLDVIKKRKETNTETAKQE